MAVKTFRRDPYATDAAGVVHEPRVTETGGGWQVLCGCGHRAEWRHSRRLTSGDSPAHLLEVSAVPESDRCRLPRRHRRWPWEACALCTGQMDLFDLVNEMEDR